MIVMNWDYGHYKRHSSDMQRRAEQGRRAREAQEERRRQERDNKRAKTDQA